MKEKRVDIYLAMVSSYQLLLLGFGGAFLNEIILDKPRLMVACPAGALSLVFLVAVVRAYRRANRLSKKNRT